METTINIPSDEDGYILLRCEKCGEFFKITADDCESDEIIEISCPACGLTSDNFATEDIMRLISSKTQNYALYAMNKALDDIGKTLKGNFIKVKTDEKINYINEETIVSQIDELEIARFRCCGRTAKVKPLLKFTGCICPCCGVMNYEVE